MTERPDSPEIEILKEVKRPLKISTAPISRLNATEIVALQSENGRTATIAGSANRLSPPSFAATRELYRRQRQEARERGFTTGSSEDRMYAQVISNARQSTGPPATLRLPTLPFTSIAGTTTLSSNGKPQAIVQPLCSTVREGTLVPLFGSVPSSSGTLPNGLVKVTDHQYQTNARAAAFAASVASVGQTFVSSATTPLFPSTTRLHHQTATPPQANARVLPADVFVDRPGAVAATATAGGSKPSVSVSERNVRPINLHDLLLSPPIPLSTSPNRTKPRLTKIVTQFSKQSSVDRCVDAVLNSVRRQPTTSSADVRERPALLPEKYYSRSLAFYGPEEEEEEYKGRFQCEWSGCDDVLPSNVSFVNHLLAHFLKSPVKLNADLEGQSDVSLADFCRCHFCFYVFGRPFDLQSHLLEVHSSRSARLNKSVQAVRTATCFICERAFASFAALQNHMGLVHQHPDAPYWCRKCRFRSSLHRDVLYHFVKEHHGTLTLICPLCLWMMDARLGVSNSRTTVINVADFVNHMQMHDERQAEKLACGRCLLTFAREADLLRHKVQHSKISSKSDVVPIPFVAGAPKPLATVERREFPCRRLLRAAVRTLTLSEGVCIECRRPMDSEAHYRPAPISCMVCPFVTTCNNSYENHVCDHARGSQAKPSNVFHRTEPLLLSVGTCACGFSSVRGNVLASHVALCVDSFDTVMLQKSVKEVPDTGPCPPAPLLTLKHLRLKPTCLELLDQWAKPLVNERDCAYTLTIERELALRAAECSSPDTSLSSSAFSGSLSPPPQLLRSLASPMRNSAKKRPLMNSGEKHKAKLPKHDSEPSAKTAKVREEDVFLPKNTCADETGASYKEFRSKADSTASTAISLRDKSRLLSILLETSNDLNSDDFSAAVQHSVIVNVVSDLVALVAGDTRCTTTYAIDSPPSKVNVKAKADADENDDDDDVVNFDDFLSQLDPDQINDNLFGKHLIDGNVIY